MEKTTYDMNDLERTKKTYVKHTMFNLLDIEARPVIEAVARETKNGVSAVEWYRSCPASLENIEYNASLVAVGHAFDIVPNHKEDEAVLNALNKVPQARPGKKGFGVRIDVVSPFVSSNYLHYFLK